LTKSLVKRMVKRLLSRVWKAYSVVYLITWSVFLKDLALTWLLNNTQLSEAELEVDSEKASYKQKLDVLQQQEELIEDEDEQERKEELARRVKREADELEARTAQSLLPDSEVRHVYCRPKAGLLITFMAISCSLKKPKMTRHA
jgi:hypothetical protein